MKLKSIIIILVLLISGWVNSQSFIRLNSGAWQPYLLNPASVDFNHLSQINMVARQQWMLFPGAPVTMLGSGSVYFDDIYTQVGIRALTDKIGYSYHTDIDLTYAYVLRFYYLWRLKLGLSLNYQAQWYDRDQISSSTQDDPTVYSRLINESNMNADVGAELSDMRWTFGFAVRNLYSLFRPDQTYFVNQNVFYADYHPRDNYYANLGGGITLFQWANQLQAQANINVYFNETDETSPFMIGMFYRTWYEIGAVMGVELFDNMKVTFNYDYNVSGLIHNNLGSPELMLTLYINRGRKCVNCKERYR